MLRSVITFFSHHKLQRLSYRPIRQIVPALLALTCSASDNPIQLDGARLEAPHWTLSAQGVHYAPSGFILHSGDHTDNNGRILSGDALRWDQRNNSLFATGRLRLKIAGLLVHAESLGSRINLAQGEAWNAQVFIADGSIEREITAGHISWNPQEIILSDIAASAGHGALLRIDAQKLIFTRRKQPADQRDGPARHLKSISLEGTTLRIASIPIFYWPIVYRDFVYDYPWTHYIFSNSDRTGINIHGDIGWRLPPIKGWHFRPTIELDAFEELGTGVSARLQAHYRSQHHNGRGRALGYAVIPNNDHKNRTLAHEGFDLLWEQSWHTTDRYPGAAHIRWSDRASWDTNSQLAGRTFAADLFAQDIEQEPLARQGASLSQHSPWVNIAIDRSLHPDELQDGTERLLGLRVNSPSAALAPQVIPQLHWQADLQGLGWRQQQWDHNRAVTTSSGTEYHAQLGFSMRSYLGSSPLASVSQLTVHGYGNDDVEIINTPNDHDTNRPSDYASAQFEVAQLLAVNWLGQSSQPRSLSDSHPEKASRWHHLIRSQVGLKYYSATLGDKKIYRAPANTGLESLDMLDEDKLLAEASISTLLKDSLWRINATTKADWYLDGDLRQWHLAASLASENQYLNTSLTTSALWQKDGWQYADLSLNLAPQGWWSWLELGHDVSRVENHWQHRPRVSCDWGRYRLQARWRYDRSDDLSADQRLTGFTASIERQLVEGRIGLSYSWERDLTGRWLDERIGLQLSLATTLIPH